ncbi:urea hydro-lyase/cyanamide hydratase [Histoplasma capsulatum var. duboisii H88]|uniref:Urea hydro-lyase/cyanamide hydratase n=2 Tax=Ajellomyces capsulatus TaxID=5037 RepID=F0UCQ4_AJEC8|nr:urea hydro-lyase/cyanamide hydratase [Histoplasma capsulatum H143]EGC43330.1 urea hydro-lyase/cyanamide hydratase [Histoplasma capsulatum var. duboisii H88]QSS49515.1 urea hydro-lyase/cyanamide hydratase [Histoplasma capsulatum var. duboisii H88]
MSNPSDSPVTLHGFTAVPASASALLTRTPEYPAPTASAPPLSVFDTPIPNTPLAKRIQAYALEHLPAPTYNHSCRVYQFGLAIKHWRFPSWSFSDETYFLACMLHDIGTTEENLRKTRLSFEFYGGMLAMEVLRKAGETEGGDKGLVAPVEQAESVVEAIIRHQDLCEVGKITAVGQLLQLATIFDNTGTYEDLVHPSTIYNVNVAFPRLKWADCFAATIRQENSLKPWAHTTALGEDEFPAKVLGNKLMAKYE